ncbi:sensor histidine kinase [Facilibium subflavum]|uniref:sensor histidine kinase n=1 Tax=Facilibium subflavum TaxID=2219058 RepID=UPI0013C31918|nr:ATP-binding protein [Facilibium subflavum]
MKSRTSLKSLQKREQTLSMLYDFAKQITHANNSQDFREIFLESLTRYFHYDFVFITANNSEMGAPFPQHPHFNQKEWVAARWCWQHKSPCGMSTQTFSGVNWYFEPLLIEQRLLGIMAIYIKYPSSIEKFMNEQLILKSMFSQISNLLLKRSLEQEERKLSIVSEQEKLQKSLLSSVSHDLKTPLASIMGTLSSVVNYSDVFAQKDINEMLGIALSESKRLDHYIDKVIQMLKVESGALKLNKQSIAVVDLIQDLKTISQQRYPDWHFVFTTSDKQVCLVADNVLLQQVLLNLIDNAVKFSPKDSRIEIDFSRQKTHSIIRVCDQGAGIDPDDLQKIFNVFYRIEKKDSYTKGHGLGLAVCKGIIEAHGGQIKAISQGHNQGTCFQITLPLDERR